MFEDAKHEGYVNDDIKRGAKDDVPVPTLFVVCWWANPVNSSASPVEKKYSAVPL